MKREQLCELGLTHVQIRAVQKIHGEDLTAMQNKMRAEMRGSYRKDLCETIGRMCEHLNAYHLRRVLSFAANAYQQQNEEVKKTCTTGLVQSVEHTSTPANAATVTE